MGIIAYLDDSPDLLDNFSIRPEYYYDPQGLRTGTKADYYNISFGWQHWLSPQLELRPEVGYWSAAANPFNGSSSRGEAPNRNHVFFAGPDVIAHF